MTPAARISAAIEILDRILEGAAAEQTLTNWARSNRYAGSGDRAAIRDHVYDALRCRSSFTALSGAKTPSGRSLMIGSLRDAGVEPAVLFSGKSYAPSPMTEGERAALDTAPTLADLPDTVALDCPSWLMPSLRAALGADFAPVMAAMRQRAPVILRVNAARGSREDAREVLRREGIEAEFHPIAPFALQITANANRIRQSGAYREGLVELQDAGPQAAVAALPLQDGMRILDFCAGGGGKSLAMAARCRGSFVAHDAAPTRMRDLPARAERAGCRIAVRETGELIAGGFDLVLTDVPCSGTGTWRRTPDAKWSLTESRLAELCQVQAGILDQAAAFVAGDGHLAYMTCSLLDAENRDQIGAFLARTSGWRLLRDRTYTPLDGSDGFYSALLRRV